jgi:leucyl/phenylalanyl-tRNA--protein transferase
MDQGAGLDGFSVDDLIRCYENGLFPMADTQFDTDFYLVDPQKRGVIPLDAFHVPQRLARTVRADRYAVIVDHDFAAVIAACAASKPGRLETWINAPIERLYRQLHALGRAHSVEVREADGALVGGLYGVSLGGAFFGESMFSRHRDVSKIALTHLVGRLIAGGYRLLDTQFITPHLAQFGAIEIARADYHRRLKPALAANGDFYRLGAAGGASAAGAVVLHEISQAS